jgi:hypothetical protein
VKFYRHLRFFDHGRVLYSLDIVEPTGTQFSVFVDMRLLWWEPVYVSHLLTGFLFSVISAVYCNFKVIVHIVRMTAINIHMLSSGVVFG